MSAGAPDSARRAGVVKTRALALGFSAVGIAALEPNPHADRLTAWLAAGYGGRMTYLNRQAKKRKDPRAILPGARCAVVTLTNYFHEPRGARGSTGARVAQYAWSTDYHAVIGPRLEQLAAAVRDLAPGARTRCYVDAGPVPERVLAQQAGLGWLAKNTMLIHPELGSFTFIASVLTDADLATDQPLTTDHCGSCRRCLEACPTEAFVAPRVLDARRCISYVTIEHRGAFDAAQRELPGPWVFGCDVCQDVCPWNERFAAATADPELAPRAELREPDLDALGAGDEEAFAHRFGDTPLARAGARGMRRNVAAARRAR